MPDHTEATPGDFRDVCFVIMPFGRKIVGSGDAAREVDFDHIYDALFAPAIAAVALPESEGGGHLRPVRTDREFHTGHIGHEMFELIEYSRFTVADISAVNANVFYELGARHRAHESGTAIFRHGDAAIPFDINQIRAFPYAIEPAAHVEESKALVRRVLAESLARNAWDSLIMLALRRQRGRDGDLQEVLLEAENALRDSDFERAHERWLRAAELDPENPLHELKASAWPKSRGDWDTVIRLLHASLGKEAALVHGRSESGFGEAHRELGIAQNKKELAEAKARGREPFARAGEEALRTAVRLAPEDFDAWSSLGGVLRRAGDEAGALQAYEKAVEVSDGHAYPLLMAIKLRAKRDGTWRLDDTTRAQLARAEGFRAAQVEHDPPIDVPWSFFDLAEIHLYLGRPERALAVAERGLALSTHAWMPGTFLSALETLPEDDTLPGLGELTSRVAARRDELAGPG